MAENVKGDAVLSVAASQFRRGIDGIEDVDWFKNAVRCDARNWSPPGDQCAHKTHWVCRTCKRRTCGVHATWHRGDFASQCDWWSPRTGARNS